MPAAATRVFLASFLVLFLEVALIRWLPAHIRLLSYFSNVILLASFLGIGAGCLLARARRDLFPWFPPLVLIITGVVYAFRLEVAVPVSGAIYFTSGASEPVVPIESTMLLPVLFVTVAALFVMLAQRMAREMASLDPLRAYTINLAGSLAGVAAFAASSWLELPPAAWFLVAFLSAVPLLASLRAAARAAAFAALLSTIGVAHLTSGAARWSPYYKITVRGDGSSSEEPRPSASMVLEVNNIFHQSMAPVGTKEYFYEWPYTVFGDTFGEVLILGAGTGTDVAAALAHGSRSVDAVEIDPVILRLGAEHHPDRPYQDPRVRRVVDDARHFLRTTDRRYDLVVFALIDSLTLQSAFSGVRLESYMFTEESFRAVRERLKPDGVLVIYNYFREPWLVDRLANTAARAFGDEPVVHVHQAKAHLAVILAGPRLRDLASYPTPPAEVAAFNQGSAPAPARLHRRDASVVVATDDWPFLYLRGPHLPNHYVVALGVMLLVSAATVFGAVGGAARRWSWEFFFLGAGFMLLEAKAITQLALLWGSTWAVASLTIASVLIMALAANQVVARVDVRRPWLVGAALVGLIAANYLLPVGRIGVESRVLESVLYASLVFSPIFCAGLIFGSSIKRSPDVAADYGANLLGAMIGGAAEYLSLVTGFRWLLILIGVFYMAALLTRRQARR
jgi:SAM-dependent methyltransferase